MHRSLIVSAFLFGLVLGNAPAQNVPTHLLLSGNIVTPDGVIPHGWLDIEGGRILHIEHQQPEIPGAQVLETHDLIFPGFVDLHNHPTFNIFPRWTPPKKFPNRYAWREWHVYQQQLESKGYALIADPANFCDIEEYAEVTARVSKNLKSMGSELSPLDCCPKP